MSSKLKVNNIIPSTGTQIGISTTGGGINLLTGTVVTGIVTASGFDGPITQSGDFTIDDYIVHAGDTNTKFGFSAADTFSVETAGSERLHIASNGEVRIGNGAPNIAVGGGLEIDTGGAATIRLEDSGQGSGFEIQNTGGVIKQRLYNNQPWTIEYGGGEKLRIQNDGTVYLRGSSSSDNHRLQVRVNDTDTEFRGSSSSGTNKGFAFYSSNTNGSEKVRIGSDGTVTLQAEDLVFGTTGKGIEFPNSVSIKQNVSNLYANLASGNNNIEFQSNGTSFVKFRGTNGDVEIVDGNLKLSTSGHGIDFSSTGGGSGTSNESEILTDYEHGEWTPILHHYINGGFSPPSYSAAGTVVGRYTKIGNIVHISASFLGFNISNAHGSSFGRITGLPFTSTNHPNHRDVISAMSDAFTTGGVNFSTYWNQTNLNSMKHGTSVFDWAILSGGSVKNLVISGHYTAA